MLRIILVLRPHFENAKNTRSLWISTKESILISGAHHRVVRRLLFHLDIHELLSIYLGGNRCGLNVGVLVFILGGMHYR